MNRVSNRYRDSEVLIQIAIGLGAGAVSALMFSAVIAGSVMGLILSYIAPLPLMIIALGWHEKLGLLGALIGAFIVALSFKSETGLAYCVGVGIPAWWLAYNIVKNGQETLNQKNPHITARILLNLALIATLVTSAGVITLGSGDEAVYENTIREALSTILSNPENSNQTINQQNLQQDLQQNMIDILIKLIPFIAATAYFCIMALNLYCAAKIVVLSKRLPFLWPQLSKTMLPKSAIAIFGLSLIISFFPGFLGVAGLSLAGSLLVVFTLQGLAFSHDITTGHTARQAILSLLYTVLIFFGQIIVPLLALIGLADTAFNIRKRFTRAEPS